MSQVQWFPGHMAKALRLIEENLPAADFVIECRDARAPHATRNPVLERTLTKKRRLIILTKRDLADDAATELWQNRLEAEGHVVLAVNVHNDPLKRLLLEKTEEVMREKWDRDRRRGIRIRSSRALIVGVPNVGKSSIINRLAARKAVNVENRPGVTQSLQKVKVSDQLELIDTPGVLWPKFESETMGIHCALVGSVKETGYPLDLITDYAKDWMIERKPDVLKSYYDIHSLDDFYQSVGKSRGFLGEGGQVDFLKTRIVFLRDVQNGRLGKITWD